MNRLTFFVVATLICLPLGAQESISYIGESDEHLVFGLDNTKTSKGAIRSGWTEWKQFVEQGSDQLGTVTKKLHSADCGERRLALRAATEYQDPTLSHVMQSFQAEPGKETYNDVIPGSIGESVLKWLCKPEAKKRKTSKAGA